MRSFFGRLDALDLELNPVALFEMVNAPIKSQQEFDIAFATTGNRGLYDGSDP